MKKLKGITRRDFLGGVACSGLVAASSPGQALQAFDAPSPRWIYPPEKTGLRGSHVGSFEVAHAVAWEGKSFERPKEAVDKPYDLIIVGGGISGLAAAVMAKDKLGKDARILILDNHDDFGGHAKRNEFTVDGKFLIGYGGSQSIDGPGTFSKESRAFLSRIGIDTEKFYRYFDQSFYERQGMGRGLHVRQSETRESFLYARDGGLDNEALWSAFSNQDAKDLAKMIDGLPLPKADRDAMHHWFVDQPDWLKGKSRSEKIAYLKTVSYEDCMRTYGGFSEEALALIRGEPVGLWGLGWDALSGLEAVRMWQGGTLGLGLDPDDLEQAYQAEEPYIFHFPDGNAGVARLAVADLVPTAIEAVDMDSEVMAKVHYDRLDLLKNQVRIRLASTAVDARNTASGVEVTYVRDGKVERVEGRFAVMACYNHVLPHIMPELPERQVEALQWPEKVPLTYVNVALRNWRAFKKAGVQHVSTPLGFFNNYSLDFPVSMGGYTFAASPDDPILLHMVHVPTAPGLPSREQHKAGRYEMYAVSFEEYEAEIVKELTASMGRFGFDADRDIAAITVNRWPHGYAYEYNELFDGSYSKQDGPHVEARKTVGKIAIANSDASAFAYVNGAVDAAHRAIHSIL